MTVKTTGNVGIGTTAPNEKLDIVGVSNGGIRLKQGAQSSNTSGAFYNGITFENSASTHAYALGYNYGGVFSLNHFDSASTYTNILTASSSGVGVTNSLSVGQSAQFQVNSSGDLAKIANVAYTWPTMQGTANSVLTNNGTGGLSWSSSASQWTTSGSNIYYSTGNVGIGTTNPQDKLTIAGSTNNLFFRTNSDSVINNGMGLRTSNTGFNLNVDSYSNIAFHTDTDFNEGGGASTEKMRITTTGNVGIGTTSPSSKLEVSGTITSTTGGFKFPDGTTMISAVKFVGSGGGAATNPTSGCPTGYILVPGDTDYGTTDFCVMKYEAKFGDKGAESRATGLPARGNFSQDTARSTCRNLGPGYALINNAEWLTIAANVANVGGNWSGTTVGSGALNRGHSDNAPADALAAVTDDNAPCTGTGQTCSSSTWHDQRRTHKLSNNNIIWDFAGNVWEWLDFNNYEDKPSPLAAWAEYTTVASSATMVKTSLVPSTTQKAWWTNTWNGASNGIGQYYAGTNGTNGALLRGGSWDMNSGAGVFAANLGAAPSHTSTNYGFRCVFRPASP